MNNIALGRYIPMNSIIHRIDPRIKIISLILLMVSIFIPAGYYGYILIGVIVLGTTLLAKLKISFLWKAMKPMLFMLVFLLVINILVVRTGDVAFSIFGYDVYLNALTQTGYIVIRLMLMVIATTILTATTKPLDMTLGIEDLLSPFKVIKVPAHEIAMMISIALRFIPTLIEETQRIMKAQASRGVDLEEGKIKEKIMAILSLIVPLFISAFQRADDLANAMEARGYIPNKMRTRYKQLHITFRDLVFLFCVIALLVGVITLAWLL